jgi:hypothetical protein
MATRNSVLEGEPVSQYPEIPASRDADIVISRSRRPALGGVTTAITLHPDNTFTVTGPDWEVSDERVSNRAKALKVARFGPDANTDEE